MEVKMNKEIRNYQESMFMGLNLRQCIFSLLAIAVAVGIYFMDFSLFRPSPFFVDPKNGDGRNNKPPAMRVRVDCYTKKLPFDLQ